MKMIISLVGPSNVESGSGYERSAGSLSPVSKLPRPSHLPLVGSALLFDPDNPHQTLLDIALEHGPVTYLGFGVLRSPFVQVADPRAAVRILRQDNTSFTKGPGYAAIKSVTPQHLLAMEGEEWRRVHRLATSVLGSAHRRHARTLLGRARDLADGICRAATPSPSPTTSTPPCPVGAATAAATAMGDRPTGSFSVVDLGGVVRRWSLGLVEAVVLGGGVAGAPGSSSSRPRSGTAGVELSDAADAFATDLQTILAEWHYRAVDLLPLWKLEGVIGPLLTRRALQLRKSLAAVTGAIEDALAAAVSQLQQTGRQSSSTTTTTATTTTTTTTTTTIVATGIRMGPPPAALPPAARFHETEEVREADGDVAAVHVTATIAARTSRPPPPPLEEEEEEEEEPLEPPLICGVAAEVLQTLQRGDVRRAAGCCVADLPPPAPSKGHASQTCGQTTGGCCRSPSGCRHGAATDARGTQAFRDGAAVLFTLLAMGHENVSSQIGWVLHLLAAHPDKQERLAGEVRAAACVAGANGPITLELLDSIRYLDCVIKESQRLYPPVPVLSRQSLQDTDVAGHSIPKGMEIVISPYVIHRLSGMDGWDEPEEFRPERFLEGKPGPFMPFGCGPRSCIGAAFGLAETKAAVAFLVLKYRMSLAGGQGALRERLFVSLRPDPSMVVEFTPR